MAAYLLRRTVASLLLLFLVLSLTFFFLQLAPGDPSLMVQDPRVPREHQLRLRQEWGLDRPLHEQYFRWLGAVVRRGDWGVSFVHGKPVVSVLRDHIFPTLLLAGAALGVEFLAGAALGIAAARRRGRFGDHAIRIGSLVAYSLPLFWTGLMALLISSYLWPLFPSGHMSSVGMSEATLFARAADLLHHLALPALVLGLTSAGAVSRFVRNSLLEQLDQDYVRTARAKGLTEDRVLWVHALRNAATPLVQMLGLSLPFLLSGSLVIEVVFSWPGLGRLALASALSRDYPVILAATALAGTLVIVGNLAADLLQAAVDPRVRRR